MNGWPLASATCEAPPATPAQQSAGEAESELVLPPDATQPLSGGTSVDSRVAPVDPSAKSPTPGTARWVGFAPAVFTGGDTAPGAWIAGPFDRKERVGWITDTATGATTQATFLWREGGHGSRVAILSTEAARALNPEQGDVANIAVYLPR